MDKLDRMEEFTVEEKSRFLSQFLFVGADLGMWCFDMNRNLYYSTCPHEKEFLSFLELGDCLDFVYAREEGWDKPVILSDELGLLWAAQTRMIETRPDLLFLIGPVFLSQTSVSSIENALREKESSLYLRRQMMRTLEAVPVMMQQTFNQYVRMLHYVIRMERIQMADFYYQDDRTRELARQWEFGMESEAVMHSDPERVAHGEKLLLQAISEGNPHYMEVMEREADFGGELLSRSGDTMRDARNTVLVFNALASRAAIDGGAPTKTAKEMELHYTGLIEKCDTITKLTALSGQMVGAYVAKVQESRDNPMISQSVRECCDYIRANVLKPLTVEEIAAQRGYTAYYFSKKFYREMGVKVTDYIKQARIEYAKIALISTTKSIQEISDSLHFGTRNYFSSVFREIVGMTPAAYRERSGRM